MLAKNRELKSLAREQLSGKWNDAVVFTLLFFLIYVPITILQNSFGEENESLLSLIVFFITAPIEYGAVKYFLDFKRGEEVSNEYLFAGFKNYSAIILLNILIFIKVFLWTLLFIIPGILAAFRYSMAIYILRDNPKMGANEILKLSSKMMDGHKWQLFVLQLSFIGWSFLALLTLGVGFLWLVPYMEVTYANFYDQVKEEQKS